MFWSTYRGSRGPKKFSFLDPLPQSAALKPLLLFATLHVAIDLLIRYLRMKDLNTAVGTAQKIRSSTSVSINHQGIHDVDGAAHGIQILEVADHAAICNGDEEKKS